ncbi:hypothetical protein BHE74_00047676, partial [Ensete ventricosum]
GTTSNRPRGHVGHPHPDGAVVQELHSGPKVEIAVRSRAEPIDLCPTDVDKLADTGRTKLR